MKTFKLKKIIASTLLVASVLAFNPMGASAEWKQNNIGWWYADGDSWATGWKQIEGKWYYFYNNGYMARNKEIDDYTLGSDGAWVGNEPLPGWEKQHDTIGLQMNLHRVNGVLEDSDKAILQAYWEKQKEYDEKYRAKKKADGTWTQLDSACYYNMYIDTRLQEIYKKEDYESYEATVNALSKCSGDKVQLINGLNYCFNKDGSLLYCARIDNTHYAGQDGLLSQDPTRGPKPYIDGNGDKKLVEPNWLIEEENYKETQSSNTVSNDINTNIKTDTSKVLSSGMTLKQAKLKIDSVIAGIKALGETAENNMDYINQLCKSMGTTYDEIKSFQG